MFYGGMFQKNPRVVTISFQTTKETNVNDDDTGAIAAPY
jgi:hypothetical protein